MRMLTILLILTLIEVCYDTHLVANNPFTGILYRSRPELWL